MHGETVKLIEHN